MSRFQKEYDQAAMERDRLHQNACRKNITYQQLLQAFSHRLNKKEEKFLQNAIHGICTEEIRLNKSGRASYCADVFLHDANKLCREKGYECESTLDSYEITQYMDSGPETRDYTDAHINVNFCKNQRSDANKKLINICFI